MDEGKVDLEMKKIQTVVLACFVVFAFSAILAATASAETTLAAEWLHNGAAVTTTLTTESPGSIELEDIKLQVPLSYVQGFLSVRLKPQAKTRSPKS